MPKIVKPHPESQATEPDGQGGTPEPEVIEPEWVEVLLRDVVRYEPVWLKVQATEGRFRRTPEKVRQTLVRGAERHPGDATAPPGAVGSGHREGQGRRCVTSSRLAGTRWPGRGRSGFRGAVRTYVCWPLHCAAQAAQ